MTNFELVEGVRARVDATYEEAKNALEQSNWDILAAVALLEKQGKASIVTEGGVQYRKEPEKTEQAASAQQAETAKPEQEEGWSACENCEGENCDSCDGNGNAAKDGDDGAEKFSGFVKRVCAEKFTVKKGSEDFVNVPAVVVPIALIAAFWPCVIVLALGMLFGLEYGVKGPSLDKTPLDSWMGKLNNFFARFRKDFSNRK